MLRLIDEAPGASGRNPHRIRRLRNTSPDLATVEQLLPLVLEDGVGGLVLWATDAPSIEVRGEETGRALREAVARERNPVA
jgi:hypothetical protein